MTRWFLPTLAALALLLPLPAWAGKKKKKSVTIPIDIGIGPAGHMITGPIQDDQTLHWGLVISVQAILDNKTLKKLKKKIPKPYRKQVLAMDELRMSPSIFIPDTLYLSPKAENTGMVGVSWTPVNLGMPIVKDPFSWRLGASLRLSGAYLYSDGVAGVDGGQAWQMLFLRPGLDLGSEIEVPFSDSFLVSGGWRSQLHIPQAIGGGVDDLGSMDSAVWHIGQPFVMLHFRVPYEYRY
jgi:hypothetical protein